MSPEVLIGAGIPCCRLVQNAGEFVVTFPRAYHSGFSHGFNCGEAANIATPEWLRVAKEAAIRRASINYPPLVVHFQLLYAHALSLSSRVPLGIRTEPRSSRLKDKNRSEGETEIKKLFVQNVEQNNDLLHVLLEQGSSCVVLPQKSSICSSSCVGSNLKALSSFSLGLCSSVKEVESPKTSSLDDDEKNVRFRLMNGFLSEEQKSDFVCKENRSTSLFAKSDQCESADISEMCASTSGIQDFNNERASAFQNDGLLDEGLFSCVSCGVLSSACAAIVQPREAATQKLASVECSFFNDWVVGSGALDGRYNGNANASELNSYSGVAEMSDQEGQYDIPVQSGGYQAPLLNQRVEIVTDTKTKSRVSSLDLVAAMYGSSSDSEEEQVEAPKPVAADDKKRSRRDTILTYKRRVKSTKTPGEVKPERVESDSADYSMLAKSKCSPTSFPIMASLGVSTGNANMPAKQTSNAETSRSHIFCLEHALEVEKQLRSIGGVHMLLLCHPEYRRIEAEAKLMAGELGFDYTWKGIPFKEATEKDLARIHSALDNKEVQPGNTDWTVKLGINLFNSINLSLSPDNRKHMPYNSIVYKAFGRTSSKNSLAKNCSCVTPEPKVEMKPTVGDHTKQALIPGPNSPQSVSITATRKTGEKRKYSSVEREIKKLKSWQSDSRVEAAEDSPRTSSPPQSGRILRSRQTKYRSIQQSNMKQETEIEGGPSTRLRKRLVKLPEDVKVVKPLSKKKTGKNNKTAEKDEGDEYRCTIEGCTMVFKTRQELALHKRNICPVRGCGKKVFSHQYLMRHQRVHLDVRPLKCPWRGCSMTFKWAWARTEHIRVHTGVRPYECHEPDCHQTFRFVSDFSRHKRKTGHLGRG